MTHVLLIEDDRTFSRILEGFLTKSGFSVLARHNGSDGLKAFFSDKFDLVLLDYRLPDMNGMEVLEQIKSSSLPVPVIIMTSFSDIRTAVKAIKTGAYEYITKPVNPDELLMIVRAALKKEKSVTLPLKDDQNPKLVEGVSQTSRQLYEYVHLVAPTNMSVIIEGESGTGKEYIARRIHSESQRASAPFVAVDCGALSKDLAASELFGHTKGAFTSAVADKTGQFEVAHGGTLLLDEVGNLSYEVQIKLLRAIQERVIQPIGTNKEIKVDVRIITATNDDLKEAVRTGTFREDLYHRLNEFKVRVPALRERREDLDEFLTFFRRLANSELKREVKGFSTEVLEFFRSYDWPGNLRELKNTVKRAVLLTTGDTIGMDTLPSEMLFTEKSNGAGVQVSSNGVYDLKALHETQEKEVIIKTLHEVRYNKSKAARLLNIDRKTLYLKMDKYGIH